MTTTPSESEPRCPSCRSADVEPIRILEHQACGAVKPESAFCSDGTLVCPDCGLDCEDAVTVDRGDLYRCRTCDGRFDVSASSSDTASLPRISLPTHLRDHQVAKAPSLRHSVGLVLLFLVITSAVVGATGAPTMFTPPPSETDGRWNEYRTIVVFRNDDIQPYYRTEAMYAVDDVFAEAGVPVTVGVIPISGEHRLEREMELCRYVRRQLRHHPTEYEVALHGYRHATVTEFYHGSEFGNVSPATQQQWISEGTAILEACTGERPTTFIPPMNTYDEHTVDALAEEDYVVVSGGSWFTDQYYNRSAPFESGGLLHAPSTHAFTGNWETGAFKSNDQLTADFDRAYENGSLYVQMLHYTSFTTERRLDALRGLIDHMQSKPGVRFMTVEEFATRQADDTVRKTADGWQVYEYADSATSPSDRLATTVRHLWTLGRDAAPQSGRR